VANTGPTEVNQMPRLSYCYGIAIYVYYGDHFPPHIHARYADSEAQIAIATGEYVAGSLLPASVASG
jgi:hypothetical protein